jgi:hypothetical protein
MASEVTISTSSGQAELAPVQFELLDKGRNAVDEFELLALLGRNLHEEQLRLAPPLEVLQLLLAFFNAESVLLRALQTLAVGLVALLLKLLPTLPDLVLEVDFELLENEFVHSITINIIAHYLNIIALYTNITAH